MCVCQRVPDQLYGTVPCLEQSPGLMCEHRPLRGPLCCCLAGFAGPYRTCTVVPDNDDKDG